MQINGREISIYKGNRDDRYYVDVYMNDDDLDNMDNGKFDKESIIDFYENSKEFINMLNGIHKNLDANDFYLNPPSKIDAETIFEMKSISVH